MKKEPTITFVGQPDMKKAVRLLFELYCKQEGYEITELAFESDNAKEETAQAVNGIKSDKQEVRFMEKAIIPTLEECVECFERKGAVTIIDDGQVIDIHKEEG